MQLVTWQNVAGPTLHCGAWSFCSLKPPAIGSMRIKKMKFYGFAEIDQLSDNIGCSRKF
jgi:hypothetical protein